MDTIEYIELQKRIQQILKPNLSGIPASEVCKANLIAEGQSSLIVREVFAYFTEKQQCKGTS
jgi:hypothetical protein